VNDWADYYTTLHTSLWRKVLSGNHLHRC